MYFFKDKKIQFFVFCFIVSIMILSIYYFYFSTRRNYYEGLASMINKNAKPTTAKPTTTKHTVAKPTTAKHAVAKPTTAKHAVAKPTTKPKKK